MPDNFCIGYDDGHELIIRNNFWKLWIYEIRYDYKTLLYLGPKEVFYKDISSPLAKKITQKEIPSLWQRCRTIIELQTRDKDGRLTKSIKESEERNFNLRRFVFQILIPHINEFIEKYRMIAYDQMVYKISPWDIPMVFLKINNQPAYSANTYDYLSWNGIPLVGKYGEPDSLQPFFLISEPEKAWKDYKSFKNRFPYEMELLDAYNFKNRGDYESAIRRAVTAFEILLDKKIKDELIKKGKPEKEVEEEIDKTITWRGGKELFYKATSKKLEDILTVDLLKIIEGARKLRHEVVHKGKKILPSERGKTRFFIDHIRFAINSLEENSEYALERDKLLLKSKIEFVDFLDQ